ncbi:Glycosyl transferase, group 1 domain protein, partial [mine drainage metagenome]
GAIRIINNLVLEKLATRMADGFFVVSPLILAAVRYWRVPENRCNLTSIIVLGSLGRGISNEARGVPPVPSPSPYVLSVGALTGRKRVDLLLRAFALTDEDRRLVILGNGPMKDELVQLSCDLGIAQRVTWLDSVSDEDFQTLIHHALFCALASEREGNPAILYEALWAGTPVIYIGGGDVDPGIGGPYFTHLKSVDPSDIAHLIE